MDKWVATIVGILLTIGLGTGVGYAVSGMTGGKVGAVSGAMQNIKAYAPTDTSGYNNYTLNMTRDNATGIPTSAN